MSQVLSTRNIAMKMSMYKMMSLDMRIMAGL